MDQYDELDRLAGSYVQNGQSAPGLLPLQTSVSTPDIEGLERGTSLINPPLLIGDLISNFPSDLYDIRPQSHLYRLMQALLGPSGAGQLQKRNLIARLSSVLGGSHFFDLDGLYGSIFGERRQTKEQFTFDPMESLASPEEWDEIIARDAGFRSRLDGLIKAIPLGGTIPGLLQAAEATVGASCDVYEIWKILDLYGSGTNISYTWSQIEIAFSTWNDFDGLTWAQVTGETIIGNSGFNNPSEIVIRPKKDYSNMINGAQEKIEDALSLNRVIAKLKPAGTFVSVNSDGLALHNEIRVAGIYSDDDFWEISKRITPKFGLEDLYSASSASSLGVSQSFNGSVSIPVPPFSGTVGHKYTVLPELASVSAYTLEEDGSSTPNDWDHLGVRGSIKDTFTPDRGVSDPRTIKAALLAEDASLIAHAYSGTRLPSLDAA